MEVTCIILPKRLGERLREKAEERGYLPEELGVELAVSYTHLTLPTNREV